MCCSPPALCKACTDGPINGIWPGRVPLSDVLLKEYVHLLTGARTAYVPKHPGFVAPPPFIESRSFLGLFRPPVPDLLCLFFPFLPPSAEGNLDFPREDKIT